jgi:hypothetical protein
MDPQIKARPAPRQNEPKPPFPRQHQSGPGLESRLDPRPRYKAEAYRPAGKLQHKVALVTGGDSGIGRAVALLYAREGAQVAIVYLPEEQPDATRRARRSRPSAANAWRSPATSSMHRSATRSSNGRSANSGNWTSSLPMPDTRIASRRCRT